MSAEPKTSNPLDTQSLIRRFLNCSICFEDFNDDKRHPRLLPCLHTYCYKYLLDLIKNESITCPLCRESYTVPNNNGSIFPKDNTRRDLLDFISAKERPSSLLCQMREDNNPAKYRCKDCSNFLCQDCYILHETIKVFKDHTTFCIDEIGCSLENVKEFSNLGLCQIEGHKGKKLEFYCYKNGCEMPICTSCAITGHLATDGHIVKDINEVYLQKVNNLQDEKKKILSKRESVQNVIECVEKEMMQVDVLCDQSKESAVAAFEFCIQILQRRRDAVCEKIETSRHQKQKVLQNQKENLTSLKESITDACSFLEQALLNRNFSAFLEIAPSMFCRFLSLTNTIIDEFPHQCAFTTFSLKHMGMEFQKCANEMGRLSTTLAYGPKTTVILQEPIQTESETSIVIQLKDHNDLTLEDEDIDVFYEIEDPDGKITRVTEPCKYQNGGYRSSCFIEKPGKHKIRIVVDGGYLDGVPHEFEAKVAKNVVGMKHELDNVQLEVKQYISPRPFYDDKVFIQGMNPETTQDYLMNFLEAKSKVCPSDIVYGEEDGTALVTFEEEPDFEKLLFACKRRPLEGFYLNVSKVPITNCILVSGLREYINMDTVKFYFENTRQSGGGATEKIQLSEDDGTCLVYFQDDTVLDEVCKRDHTINEQKLKVRVYHECLGQIPDDGEGSATGGATGRASGRGERKFKQPEPYSINDADKRKVEFLKHSNSVKVVVEKQLKTCHATIQWPARKTDPVIIHCILTPDVKDCRTLAKAWRKTATENLNKFLDALIVEELLVLQEAWTQVVEGLQSMTISHPDDVGVVTEPDNCKIIIVGYKHIVKSVSDQVKQIITKVGEKLDRKKKQMTEKMSAKFHQLRLLMIKQFPDKMKKQFEGLAVKINIKSLEITFEGLGSEITAAKLEMYETFNKIGSAKVGQFSKHKLEFCESKKVKEYFVDKLKKVNIVAVWEVESERNIVMYAMSDKDAVNASHILQQSMIESPVSFKPESVYLLQSQIWDDKKKEVENVAPGLVKIVPLPDQQQIIIFTTTEYVGTCRELVEDFFTLNTVYEKVLSLSHAKMRFLPNYQEEIQAIANDLKQEQVKISVDNTEIRITGTNFGLNKAQKRVDEIIKKLPSGRKFGP